MSVTITVGKAGRLVIPKAIRESLGLREGSRLRVESAGGRLEAVPEPDEVEIQMRDGFPSICGGPPRKKGDIVKAIKAGREERAAQILAYRKKK
jgi:AbrB family looped-hinge helix DNA binding protein